MLGFPSEAKRYFTNSSKEPNCNNLCMSLLPRQLWVQLYQITETPEVADGVYYSFSQAPSQTEESRRPARIEEMITWGKDNYTQQLRHTAQSKGNPLAISFHAFISDVNSGIASLAVKSPRTKKRAIDTKSSFSKTSPSNASTHTNLFPTFSCCVFHPVSSGNISTNTASKGLPPVLILSCFQAILSSLPSSFQSQIPHGPGVCHIFSITQTILKGSQLHPPKL